MSDEDKIRAKAHDLWVKDGMPEGKELEHWEKAKAMLAKPKKAAAPKKEPAAKKAAAAKPAAAKTAKAPKVAKPAAKK